MSGSEACRRAGYGKNKENINRIASQILSNIDIRSAIDIKLDEIRQTVGDQIKATTNEALDAMKGLLKSNFDFAKFNAAKYFLDVGGHKVKEEIEHKGKIKIEFEYFDTPPEPEDDDNIE